MFRFVFLAAMLVPGIALAVGSDTTAPPKPTATTQTCTKGQVWDEKTKACVDPRNGQLDDDTLYGAVREFAYAGQYDDALQVLAAMSDPTDDRVMTYMGFINRKQGHQAQADGFYRQALQRNPGNILARSYMGQGFAERGDLRAAQEQLVEIQARGGAGTWAETALARAISTGKGYSY